jgi:hypothetical protein
MILCTFTPLQGITDLVTDFLEKTEGETGKFCIQADWNDVPHLSAEAKAELLASIPEWQRDARSRGIPLLGAGKIYQVAEEDILVSDFSIPDYYARC